MADTDKSKGQKLSCCALNLYMGRGQDAHTTIILCFCRIQSSCASAYQPHHHWPTRCP